MIWNFFTGKIRKILGIPKLFDFSGGKETAGGPLMKFIACGSCSMLFFLLIISLIAILVSIIS